MNCECYFVFNVLIILHLFSLTRAQHLISHDFSYVPSAAAAHHTMHMYYVVVVVVVVVVVE